VELWDAAWPRFDPTHDPMAARIVHLGGPIYDGVMVRVSFTPNLRRHLPCPSLDASGGTVGEVLAEVFARQPRLKSYVLDDQARLRRHVTVYLNSRKADLAAPVASGDEVYIMQALSGG
jgi:molybdopterin synthase sulfur carrier subunit